MALIYKEASDFVLKKFKKEPHLAAADYRTIWRKLFLDGIFKLDLPGKQYLIIDALDECRNGVEIVPFWLKLRRKNVCAYF